MKKIYTSIIALTFCFASYGQDQAVTVIGAGDGANKTIATNQALRNCIEKSMGAFLSSSTVVSNDSLVKDEIITIASGNIVSYTVLSEINQKDNWNVSVSAVISPEKMITTLKAKGFNFELNGGVYAQNILKEKFYAAQEKVAIQNFLTTWEKIQLFDFDIKLTEPKATKVNDIGTYKTIDAGILKDLKEPLLNSIKTIIASYNDNSIYFTNGYDVENTFRGYYGNMHKDEIGFGKEDISSTVSYSMFAVFTPKLNSTYISFVKSLLNLLNSISIKDIESYKNLNPKYLSINIETKNIDAKKAGVDFTAYPKDQFGNTLFYLRNPDNKELLIKLSEHIRIKSTALNFKSEAVENLQTKSYFLYESDRSPNLNFYNPLQAYYIQPFYCSKNGNLEAQSFRPTFSWIFLTFDELQNLKKIEFKPKE